MRRRWSRNEGGGGGGGGGEGEGWKYKVKGLIESCLGESRHTLFQTCIIFCCSYKFVSIKGP